MDLGILWFIFTAVLFIGFFFLEGFDFGAGILLPILGKKDEERRQVINAFGPFWDANEVWLITAGGAIFAAFPHWYATMFSGFYLPLLLILSALILRAVAVEFRGKGDGQGWKNNWDRIIFGSCLVLSLLWGVALANLIKGVPIDGTMNYVGGFFDMISVYTLLGGITTLLVFMFHGAVFISLRSEGVVEHRAIAISHPLGIAASVSALLLIILSYFQTDLFNSKPAIAAAVTALVLLLASWYLMRQKKAKGAMLTSGASIALGVGALFLGLFPRVMVSSIDPAYSLTIAKASSSPYTLSLMTKVALIFLPIVIGYQIWSYYIFRKRVTTKDLHY